MQSIYVALNNLKDIDGLISTIEGNDSKCWHSYSPFLYYQRSFHRLHDERGRQAVFEQLCHSPQVLADVEKELLISRTEILQARLIVPGSGKAMLGATAPAGGKNLTLLAPGG